MKPAHKKMLLWGALAGGVYMLLRGRKPVRRKKRPGEVFVSNDANTRGLLFDCNRGGASMACLDLTDQTADGYIFADPTECADLISQRPDKQDCLFLAKVWKPE